MTRREVPPPDGGVVVATDRRPAGWLMRLVRRYLGVGPYLTFGGDLLPRLAEHGSASGFERSEYAAGLAREAAPGCPVHTTLDGIPSGVFRGITAVDVLRHLDHLAPLLACWRRVLVPGGRVLVVAPCADGRTHARWRRVFVDAGFVVVREGGDGVHGDRRPAAPRAWPGVLQNLSGRLFLRPGRGESSVFVLER